jgi:hypothetical protein
MPDAPDRFSKTVHDEPSVSPRKAFVDIGWLLAASSFASSTPMAPPAPRIVIISISFRLEDRWKDKALAR